MIINNLFPQYLDKKVFLPSAIIKAWKQVVAEVSCVYSSSSSLCLVVLNELKMSPLRFFSSFEAPVETGEVVHQSCYLIFCSSLWEFTGDFEETFAENSEPQNEFDMIIGAIEDIVVDDRFQELQNRLLEQNYQHFEVRFKIKTRTNFLFLTLACYLSIKRRERETSVYCLTHFLF